jgi:tripartite-type tricarboxylate transporter receptor subunit TctC
MQPAPAVTENAIAIRPGFKKMTPHFDPLTQFDSVALVATSPLVLCVTNDVTANNMKELIALSRPRASRRSNPFSRRSIGRREILLA